MRLPLPLAAAAALAVLAAALAADAETASPAAKVDPAVVDGYVARTFKGAPAEWRQRIRQDETQRLCSQYRGNLPKALYGKVLAREKASVVMPADGNVIGDWRNGEKLAQNGRGGQFSDPAGTAGGGNCYACHQLAREELSYGTLGPSLLEYGKMRKYAPEDARAAYAKIYDAQSVVPCSNMPRFGHNKFLTEQQIKDLVALLFDPKSPVNK